MPASDKPGMPDGCYLCDRTAGLLHHISYIPEIVILLCSECHGKAHSEDFNGDVLFPELSPGMSRGEWKEEVWSGEWIPRPTSEQIDWDENNVGRVKR